MKFFRSQIFHKRLLPRENRFQYKSLYMTMDLDELGSKEKPFLFSWESFNLFSFYRKDHGHRDGTCLRQWVKESLAEVGIKNFEGSIVLQTMPRIWGYVFNPVSFYYCYENGEIKYVIAEVNNTFGESHSYIIKNPNEGSEVFTKEFHVSPFFPRQGSYQFKFEKDSVLIEYDSSYGNFVALLKGEEIPLTSLSLLKLSFTRPFNTFFIVILIHYQALKLYLKKTPFYSKPAPKINKVTKAPRRP